MFCCINVCLPIAITLWVNPIKSDNIISCQNQTEPSPSHIINFTTISFPSILFIGKNSIISLLRMQLQMMFQGTHLKFKGSRRCMSDLPTVTCRGCTMGMAQRRTSLTSSTLTGTSLAQSSSRGNNPMFYERGQTIRYHCELLKFSTLKYKIVEFNNIFRWFCITFDWWFIVCNIVT